MIMEDEYDSENNNDYNAKNGLVYTCFDRLKKN